MIDYQGDEMRKAAEVSRDFSAAVHLLIRIVIVKNKSEPISIYEVVRESEPLIQICRQI